MMNQKLIRLAVAALILGSLTVNPSRAAQDAPESWSLALSAWLCPVEYDGATLSEDCEPPLPDTAFILEPGGQNATTDDQGQLSVTDLPRGDATLRRADDATDTLDLMSCVYPLGLNDLVALEMTYEERGGVGFSVDPVAEPRALEAGPTLTNVAVSCQWYVIPGAADTASDNQLGLLRVRALPGQETSLTTAAPGEVLEAPRSLVLGAAPALDLTLVDNATGDTVDITTEVTNNTQSSAVVAVPEGDYTLINNATDDTSAVTITAGQTALAQVIAPSVSIAVPSVIEIQMPVVRATATAPPPTPTATIPAPTATATVPPPTATAPDATPQTLTFNGNDWSGGFSNLQQGVYGRPAVALYGQASGLAIATLSFSLDAAPTTATIILTGLDDELANANPIQIAINGAVVYEGASPFPNWDPAVSGANWASVTFEAPPGLLQAGRNTITVTNLSPSAATGVPPYILLAEVVIEVS